MLSLSLRIQSVVVSTLLAACVSTAYALPTGGGGGGGGGSLPPPPPPECVDSKTLTINATPNEIVLGGSPATVSWAYQPPAEYAQVTGLHVVVDGAPAAWVGTKSVKPLSDWPYVAQVVYDPVGQAVLTVDTLVRVDLPKTVDINGNDAGWRALLMQAVGTPNTIVRLGAAVDMDMSGQESIPVAPGVTLMGGQPCALGTPSAPEVLIGPITGGSACGERTAELAGPRLSTHTRPKPLFDLLCDGNVVADNIRITGFRLQGPDTSNTSVDGDDKLQHGINITSCVGVDIGNMELSGWSGAAVFVQDLDGSNPPVRRQMGPGVVRIHDSYIHHNQHIGKGAVSEVQPVEGTVCVTRPVDLKRTTTDLLFLEPHSDVMWLGATIDGNRWVNGEYRPISDARSPITVSLSLDPHNASKKPSAVVSAPTLSTMRDALNQVRAQMDGATLPAMVDFSQELVSTKADLMVHLGGRFDGTVHKVVGNFDFSDTSKTNKVVSVYQQVYFTADVDTPRPDASVFASGRAYTDNEMLISSISYGRQLILTAESEDAGSDLQTAVQYSYKGGVSGSADAKLHNEQVLRRSKVNVFILGGSADAAQQIVIDTSAPDGGVAQIRNYINSGATFNKDTAAEPVSYRLRFLKDNAIGNVNLTTSFTERQCVQSVGRVAIRDLRIRVVKESDSGNNIELYGNIAVTAGPNATSDIGTDVWRRNSSNYVEVNEGAEISLPEPTLTFDRIDKTFDQAYVRVAGDLWDQDDTSADDHISSDGRRVDLRYATAGNSTREGAPSDEQMAEFGGDGNIVQVLFRVVLE
jgi:hypothetical protein